jgi:MPBQ/MSBQ methyltransferase
MIDICAGNASRFSAQYDALILAPDKRALYGSDFFNVGWWADGAATLAAACEALVIEHARCIEAVAQPGGVVLDIGCGLGGGTALLSQRWPHTRVIGVNISPRQVAFARARHAGATFRAIDAMSPGIAHGTVDAIVSVEAAQHFPSRRSFLTEARQVLRAGGRLVFSDLSGANPRLLGAWMLPEEAAPCDLDSYVALCRDGGFVVEQLRDVTRETWYGFCAHLAGKTDTKDIAAVLPPSCGRRCPVVSWRACGARDGTDDVDRVVGQRGCRLFKSKSTLRMA